MSSKKLPICLDTQTGVYTDDILEVEDYYERNDKSVDLSCPLKVQNVSANIYSVFCKYLKESHNKEILRQVKQGLQGFEDHLTRIGGPYMNGANPSISDCVNFPKLYHIRQFFLMTGAGDILAEYPKLSGYYSEMEALPETEHLKSSTESLVEYYTSKGVSKRVLCKK